MADFNWDQLAGDLKVELLDGIKGLVSGAKADLEEFGRAIAQDMVRAVREKDEALLKELGHQLEALGEVNRIRAVNATWEQVSNIAIMVGRVALKTALAAV